MKERNIQFEIVSESEAIAFMESNNYYFKLASFRKNFPKLNGKYLNLDFAYLQDLAAIDANLRRYLSDVSLAVEHGLKVKILDLITKNKNEDGYSIVQEFRNEKPKSYGRVLSYLKANSYSRDLYKKHHKEPAIWVFLEVAPFGDLSQFIEFYYKKYPSRPLKVIINNMRFAKNIRNAAAHSNPILVNLFTTEDFLPHPTQAVVSEANLMSIDPKLLTDMKVHDLVALFYLNKLLTSDAARNHFYEHGQMVLTRFNRHSNYYETLPSINQFKAILSNIVDYQLTN
ncbi:Abi family protein [Pediococcus pentosaceus]|jgi:abortive infection bacteriophage resistance protein|uniref:Abi family protein n=1 Tax=Pediococcus pentosaceus TaxID=1255 RepID=UPI00132FA81E|nr:Abi family protein [Pediococcus pentosaceus]KAF0351650.1 Abi family protein [Pediococcus pentosaceus]MBF7106129.1 Abi family protein [Pediococcus pentosaceus]